MAESGIPLQTDTVAPLPGDGVRTITATVPMGDGTRKTFQMQVVSIADEQGRIIDFQNRDLLSAILVESVAQTRLLAIIANIPQHAAYAPD